MISTLCNTAYSTLDSKCLQSVRYKNTHHCPHHIQSRQVTGSIYWPEIFASYAMNISKVFLRWRFWTFGFILKQWGVLSFRQLKIVCASVEWSKMPLRFIHRYTTTVDLFLTKIWLKYFSHFIILITASLLILITSLILWW